MTFEIGEFVTYYPDGIERWQFHYRAVVEARTAKRYKVRLLDSPAGKIKTCGASRLYRQGDLLEEKTNAAKTENTPATGLPRDDPF